MKKLVITAMLSMIACFAYSQWNWSNPSPFGWYMRDVHFSDEQTGYMVGEKGVVLKTTDAGTTWEIKPTGTLRNLEMVWFTDAETGYVASDGGFIMKTTDGGDTWQELQSGTTEEFNDIFFINSTTGFIAGMNGQLLRTTDGGETWQRAFIDIYSDVYSVHFVNENVGYAAASMRTVFKTVNGGDTWTSISGDPYIDLHSVFFLTPNTGYAAGNHNFMMKTTNGGASWTEFQSNIPVDHLQFLNEQTGYALSYDTFIGISKLVKTINGGTTWTPVGMDHCVSYFFTNNNTVFGAAYPGKIYKSTDAGVTYVNYTSTVTEADIWDVHFIDESTGYAVSHYHDDSGLNYDQVLKTADAGESWQIVTEGQFDHLISVYFTDENVGYISGWNGKLFKTTDGAQSWDTLLHIPGTTLRDLTFINENTGFVAGAGLGTGYILRTDDGGISWNSVYEGLFVSGIHFIDENLGFGLANYHIVKTTDGGISWAEYNDGNFWILFDIFFVNSNVGFACGSGGAFLKTTDGGESWIDLTQNFGTFMSVYFVDEDNGYMCGDNCSFYQTSNGGHNWTSIDYLSCIGYGTIFFTDELTGYIVGEDGRIFKTTNGGLVSAKENVKPESGYSLFPNPANAAITINSAKNATGVEVNITVLNCNGMQVMHRIFKDLPIRLDVSNLASGIYFVRIETSESVETKKMVKI
jgi:photosystem II stability/assembly factor-like uncharacterized protein